MAWMELEASDGHRLQAWCARPQGQPRGAVVVLQEIFGVNAHIRAVCDRWASEGWLALAPALYDRAERGAEAGYGPDGIARGRALKEQVDDASALRDVQAAVDFARGEVPCVAVIGFCWGGTLAWLAAARLWGVDAAVAFYGTAIAAHVDEPPKVPVLLHFGDQDAHIPAEHVAKIAAAWPALPLYLYPAGHGFHCDDRPAYHADSATLAAARTRDFLKDTLRC